MWGYCRYWNLPHCRPSVRGRSPEQSHRSHAHHGRRVHGGLQPDPQASHHPVHHRGQGLLTGWTGLRSQGNLFIYKYTSPWYIVTKKSTFKIKVKHRWGAYWFENFHWTRLSSYHITSIIYVYDLSKSHQLLLPNSSQGLILVGCCVNLGPDATHVVGGRKHINGTLFE